MPPKLPFLNVVPYNVLSEPCMGAAIGWAPSPNDPPKLYKVVRLDADGSYRNRVPSPNPPPSEAVP